MAKGTIGRPSPTRLIGATLFVAIGATLCLPYLVVVSGGAGLVRPIYPFYALAIALALVSRRRSLFLSFVVGMFAFTPFIRRIVDIRVGFEAFNPILLAPYAALLPTLPAIVRRVLGHRAGFVWPFTLLSICIVYAAYIALLSMRTTPAVYESLRWLLPMSLCVFIMDQPGQMATMRRSLYISLLTILPILTLYGVWQYVDPPQWDTFWMTNVHDAAFGFPRPYEVRVFSMMNGPLSVAVFAVSAMILLATEGMLGLVVAAAALPLLVLTLDRQAWLFGAIGLSVLILQASAAQKFKLTLGLAVTIFGGVALLGSHLLPSNVVNQLTNRFGTFSDVRAGTDESAGDRLAMYVSFIDRIAKSPLGEGFGANASTATTAEKRDLPPLDSAILEAGLTFGIPMGMIYFISMGALIFAACRSSRLDSQRFSACSALVIGNIATSPLGASLFGEASILTWVAIGILLANAELAASRQRRGPAPSHGFASGAVPVDGARRLSRRAGPPPLGQSL